MRAIALVDGVRAVVPPAVVPLAVLLLAVVLLSLSPSPAVAAVPTAAFDPGLAGFTVRIQGEVNPYSVLAVSLLPGEILYLEVMDNATGGPLRLERPAPDGAPSRPPKLLAEDTRSFTWRAPRRAGTLEILDLVRGDGARMRIPVFILVPATQVRQGMLEGYRIGDYPATPLRGLSIYRAPRGFIRVTPEMRDLQVSPHFRLGQFLCKQASSWPKFVLVRERLVLKLEFLLQTVNQRGFRTDSFVVMSGYRTPAYNRAIGNVTYSRHLWGGAADIFIDREPADGMMDDLDGDGRVDGGDADFLYELVDGLLHREDWQAFVGGLGRYRPNAARGPFIHVDARGFRARWGQ